MKPTFILVVAVMISILSCTTNNHTEAETETEKKSLAKCKKSLKPIIDELPVIGLLAYDGVLMTEVTAPLDVFSKFDINGNQLFNVIVIAQGKELVTTEEGLKIAPDYTFENSPKLDVLFVPSAYDMTIPLQNNELITFIKEQNNNTQYTVSNCAGAQLIGVSGIADGKKMVTWIGGGKQLQKDYPKLIVQNDSLVTYVEDGKFSSSNGNMASYISSLELLSKMTNSEHREYVESYLYLDRLKNWK